MSKCMSLVRLLIFFSEGQKLIVFMSFGVASIKPFEKLLAHPLVLCLMVQIEVRLPDNNARN